MTSEEAQAPAAAPAPPTDALTANNGPTTQPSQPAGPTPVLFLAYSYALNLEIPSERLASVMDRHVQACQAAGPRVCQLIGSSRTGDPESQMQGYLSLRAEPNWLNTFKSGMAQQADEAGQDRYDSETDFSRNVEKQKAWNISIEIQLEELKNNSETKLKTNLNQ